MQVRESIKTYNIEEKFEYAIIKRSLVNYFSYYDEQRKNWRSITNFSDPECEKDLISIRCKYSRQTLSLNFPFMLESKLIYLWGLITGAAHRKKQLEICVDANQESAIQAAAKQLGIQIAITPIQRYRRRRGTRRTLSRYRKIRVIFPFVFKKFLYSLGYRSNKPAIPQWLSSDQQMTWLEGYLNSPKVQCSIQKKKRLSPKITIFITQNAPQLLRGINEILDQLNITYSVYLCQNRLQITIQNRSSLLILAKHFFIQRPKVRALMAILYKIENDSALHLSLQKFNLTEFQFTLYGLVLDQPLQELEYTLFENTFACSSNDIRQDLYLLDKVGLINYYKKENNKEFLIYSTRYLNTAYQILKSEEKELQCYLKYSESNTLSFHCVICDQILSYTEAMGENSFQCPYCSSRKLHPIEISKYIYYGHLGWLIQEQRMLQRGIE